MLEKSILFSRKRLSIISSASEQIVTVEAILAVSTPSNVFKESSVVSVNISPMETIPFILLPIVSAKPRPPSKLFPANLAVHEFVPVVKLTSFFHIGNYHL